MVVGKKRPGDLVTHKYRQGFVFSFFLLSSSGGIAIVFRLCFPFDFFSTCVYVFFSLSLSSLLESRWDEGAAGVAKRLLLLQLPSRARRLFFAAGARLWLRSLVRARVVPADTQDVLFAHQPVTTTIRIVFLPLHSFVALLLLPAADAPVSLRLLLRYFF